MLFVIVAVLVGVVIVVLAKMVIISVILLVGDSKNGSSNHFSNDMRNATVKQAARIIVTIFFAQTKIVGQDETYQ